MHFRAQRKLQGEVSLSEAIETDKAGNALYLQDVVGADDTMQEDLEGREDQRLKGISSKRTPVSCTHSCRTCAVRLIP